MVEKYWINKYPSIKVWFQRNQHMISQDEKWFKETFTELEYLRKIGAQVIQTRGLEIVHPKEDNIYKLWYDYERYFHPTELDYFEDKVKEFITKNYNFLPLFYLPNIINTLDYWYYIWEALHIDHNCPIEEEDYQLYFTLLRINHPDYPFKTVDGFSPTINKYYFIKRWSSQLTREVKKAKLYKLLKDPTILAQCAIGNFQLPPNSYPLEEEDLSKAYTRKLLKEKENPQCLKRISTLVSQGYTIKEIKDGNLLLEK